VALAGGGSASARRLISQVFRPDSHNFRATERLGSPFETPVCERIDGESWP